MKKNDLLIARRRQQNGNDLRSRCQRAEERIKELEASIRQLGSLAFLGNKPLDQIIAHFIAWGQSNHEYTERLEAAFLEAKISAIMGAISYGEALGLRERMDITAKRSDAVTDARAALEEIKYGRIERNGNCEAAISSKTRS